MKKKTTICLLSCLVAITAASTSISVAWYSTAAFLSVEDINVTLSGSSPLLIGTTTKKEDFKPALEYEDLKKIDAFVPVTGIYREDWENAGADYPILYDTYNSRATTVITSERNIYAQPFDNVATSGYFSQELYLKADNDYYAMIDTSATFIEPNKLSNRTRAQKLAKEKGEKTEEEYYNDLNNIIYSARFSILVDSPEMYDYKLFDPYKNQEKTNLGGLIDTGMTGLYDTAGYLENKVETLYGEVNDRSLISYLEEPQPEGITGQHTWYNSGHDKTAQQIDFQKSYQNGLEIKSEDALSLDEYGALKEKITNRTASKEEINRTLMIPIRTGVPTRIVYSIYFEGFDLDSIDETMSASFTSKITFDVVDINII